MKDRIEKLLSVKSIVTLILTLVFAYLSVTGAISGQEFMTVFVVIISFYFGTQHQKNEPTDNIELGGTEYSQIGGE